MKNIEKYIIGILVFVAVGAIGTAVYFGINADKDNSKKEDNKQEEVLGDESKETDEETNEQTSDEDDKNEEQNIYSEISNEEVRNIFLRLKNVFAYDFNSRVNMYNDFSDMSQEEITLNLLLNLAYEENFDKIKITKDSSFLNDDVYNYFCKDSNNYGICGINGKLNLENYCDIYILPVSKLKELYKEIVGREIEKEELKSIEYYRYFDYHEEDELFYIVQPGGGGGDVSIESLKVAETEKQITINYIINSHPDYHDEPWTNEFKFSFIKSSNGNWYFEKLEVVKVS